ncbi:MAG: hypothetical protein HY547_01920 [Elusimicrobia bacterium]|nr:hypothetical protein [Elusimicrobiota bacterium]
MGVAPIGIDPRHVHLSQEHFHLLFGPEAKPRRLKGVKQPGYYAGWETVKLVGPKGELPNARVIFPCRTQTQVEVTRTDAIGLGIRAPLRKSGDLLGSAPVTIAGPLASLTLREGCIVPWRHIHMHTMEAERWGLKQNDFVRVRAGDGSGRELVFDNVWIRAADWYALEFHLDTDEANAAGLGPSDQIVVVEQMPVPSAYGSAPEEFETPGWREFINP